MSIYNADKAWLLLADGTLYAGHSFGAQGTAIGEVVFTTGMAGCQETLTDPGNHGQIAVQTFPLIGNYGTNDEDVESDHIYMKGYVVREWCDSPSNFRATDRIDSFLKRHGCIGLFDVDTRALTRHLREQGVMPGAITTEEPVGERRAALLAELAAYTVTGAVAAVTCPSVKVYPAHGEAKYRVALFDLGYKRNIREALRQRGCDVVVVPASTGAEALSALEVQGAVLSNGPGDPAENTALIAAVRALADQKLPLMGISLGHQILALAMGAQSRKMRYGHRGNNLPVTDLESGHTFITAQSHGHVVVEGSLDPAVGVVSHQNANERSSCEGIRYLNIPAFSVQFYPEVGVGPADTSHLYDRFLSMIDQKKEG